MMTLNEIAAQLGCPLMGSIDVKNIVIDSRQVEPGSLFVALKGERFDGHDYMAVAEKLGAIGVLCEKNDVKLSIPQLIVPSSLAAMTHLATYYRQKMNCPVIAVTGSNGKTSVKEMIYSILPKPAHATPGNLNNHIGVPLAILQMKPEHRYAVFELGANHLGEIAHTAAMVKPLVTLINNIGPAHIAEFGSIDNVARAKGEIHQGLMPNGTAVINDDDEYAHVWDGLLIGKKTLRFSIEKPSDVYAKAIILDADGRASFVLVLPTGEAKVHLQVPGLHVVRNALAAAACCYAVGISLPDIVLGLTSFHGVSGRMTFLQGKNHALIIDDTYNANLRSVLAAVDVLSKREGQRILVLGDLGELGDFTQSHHEEIGRVAKEKGIDRLMTCGNQSKFSTNAFGALAKHYVDQQQLTHDLLPYLNEKTTVLVKGSRSAAMEKVVHELLD